MRKASITKGLTLCASVLAVAGCSLSADAPVSPESAALSGSAPFMALMKEAGEAAEDGDLVDAGRLLDEAKQVEPENPALWVEIARLRFRGGEHAQALEAADYALELGPEFAPALLLHAQLVRDAHGLSDALVWFEAALEANPDDPLALREYAATLGDAGYNAEMLGVVRALADIAPKDPNVLYLQAVLAARAGNPVLAKSLLERSGLSEAGVPAAMMLDALVSLQEKNHDSAAETLQALAQKQPSNGRIAELLARALWLSGRDEELIERFAPRAQQEDTSPYLVMLVGRALERSGDRAGAVPFLERAYAGREAGWVTLPDLANLPEPTRRMRALIKANQTGAATRYGRELRKQFSGSSDIAALSADAAMARRDYQGALELYREAALVRRPWPLTRKAAAAYRDLGDPVASDVLIARHLVGEPRNTEALLLNAERAARNEDWLRVAVLLDNAIDLGAGNDPRLLKLRGIAARALGNEDEARRFERMTWDLHPGILPTR
ncbi:MAG: hypothetical protein WBA51_15470 [Erythrobacter sp.]